MTRLAAVLFVLALPIRAEVIELPQATLAELACAPEIIRTPSHEHHHHPVAQTLLSVRFASEASEQTGVSVLQPPPLATNFFSASSKAVSPADAAGAAGPHNIVSAFNSGLFVYDRSGNPTSSVSLPQFWSDPSITSGLYYDPRILYDRFADRWFVVALYDNNFKNSTVVVGVSATGDPNGSWSRYRISVGSDLADFTRLGMSADRFIITANSSVGTRFWAIAKADAYSTLTSFQSASAFESDFMPVTIVDNSTTTAYLVANNSSGTATLWRLDAGANKPSFISNYTTAPWSELFNTEVGPEASGQSMDVGDTTMQAAVARGGVIWATHSIVRTTAPLHTGIRWWRIPIDGSAAETGTIDDPTAATFYAFPSIAVNRIGGALISYSLFAANRFPTAAYAYRDPSGAMSTTGILKEGETPPLDARWGDYTTAVVDPANDLDFWTVQSYGNSQLWATWWGEITIPAPPARSRAVRH